MQALKKTYWFEQTEKATRIEMKPILYDVWGEEYVSDFQEDSDDECESLESSYEELRSHNSNQSVEPRLDCRFDQALIPMEYPSDEEIAEMGERVSELHVLPEQFGLVGGGKKKEKRQFKKKKAKKVACGPYIKSTNKEKDIAPPHRFENLTYNDEDTVMNGATPFIITSYQFTSAYDASSGILTTAYAGFEENSAFYDNNRVHKTEAIWDVANNEATVGLRVGMIPTTYDASANVITYQGAIDLMEGPYSTGLIMLGRANGGECVHKFEYTLLPQMLLGDTTYFSDIDYAGAFNASPARMLYLNLVVISVGSATNLTNGVTGNFSMRSLVKFFNRRVILDPEPLKTLQVGLIDRKLVKPEAKVRKRETDSDSEDIVVVSSKKKRIKS